MLSGTQTSDTNSAQAANPTQPMVEANASAGSVGGVLNPNNTAENRDDIARAMLELFERTGSGLRIRGLGRTRTELNGREIFTVPGGHALSWSDVSSVWMAGVDSYKSPDASMIEGGPGGTLNIRTLRPFDAKQNHTAYLAQISHNKLLAEYDPRIALLHSQRWQTDIGEFGALFNVLYDKDRYRTDKLTLQPFYVRPDLSSDANTPLTVPRGVAWKTSQGEHQQRTLSGVLQWQANSSLQFTWQSLLTHKNTEAWDFGYALQDTDTGLFPAEGTEFSVDQHGIFQAGELWSNSWRGELEGNGPRLNGTSHFADRASRTTENSLAFSYVPDERWAVMGDVQYLTAKTALFDFNVTTSSYVPSLSLDLTTLYPSIQYGGAQGRPTQSETFWNSAMDHWEDNHADMLSARIDFLYDIDGPFGLAALKFGGRRSAERVKLLNSGYNWGSLSDHWNAPLKMIADNHPEQAQLYQLNDFFDGRAEVDTAFYLAAPQLLRDQTLASSVLSEADGWHFDEYQDHDHSSIERNTNALYGMFMLDYSETPLGPMSGHLGLRMVESSVAADGYAEFKKLDVDAESLDPADLAFANGEFYSLSETAKTLNLLPSAYFQMDLAPALVGRVAASKTLSQPDISQLKPYGTVNAETETQEGLNGESQTLVKRWYGSAGNPALKPVKVKQYDASLEWQFSATGNVYSALFYKRLSDSHEKALALSEFTNNGETRDVEVERLSNAGDANIQGVEIGLQNTLGFLPGALSNIAWKTTFTKVSSRSTTVYAGEHLPLEGLSENNLAVSGTYQNQYFSTTFNYGWRSDYLLSAIDVDSNRSTWHKGYGRLDASLAVNVSKNSQLAFVVQNIGNKVYETERGPYQGSDGFIDPKRYDSSWTLHDPQWRLELRGTY